MYVQIQDPGAALSEASHPGLGEEQRRGRGYRILGDSKIIAGFQGGVELIARHRTGGRPIDAEPGNISLQVIEVEGIAQRAHGIKRSRGISAVGIERYAGDPGIAAGTLIGGVGVVITGAQAQHQIVPETVIRAGGKAED